MGFFDHREFVPSVLTAAMADQTTKLNAAGSQGVQPMINFVFQLIAITSFCFYFEWRLAIALLIMLPLILYSQKVQMQIQYSGFKKAIGPSKEDEANLLMGDAINNFKTVQSFGYEDLIVEEYKELLADSVDEATWKNI